MRATGSWSAFSRGVAGIPGLGNWLLLIAGLLSISQSGLGFTSWWAWRDDVDLDMQSARLVYAETDVWKQDFGCDTSIQQEMRSGWHGTPRGSWRLSADTTSQKRALCLPPNENPEGSDRRQATICCTPRMASHCPSMFAMAQLFFRQQTKRHNDQTATGICRQRRIKAEKKPVCYGYEENAQSNIS